MSKFVLSLSASALETVGAMQWPSSLQIHPKAAPIISPHLNVALY